jgi:hypothetical protein
MKFLLVLIGFMFLLVGCMPSMYQLPTYAKKNVTIQFIDHSKGLYRITEADETNLYTVRMVETDSMKQKPLMNDEGKPAERVIEKAQILTITDQSQNDITGDYIETRVSKSDQALMRIAEVQTKLYNVFVVDAFISLATGVALYLTLK